MCLSQVPGSSALDNELDDGLGATGNLRATLGATAVNTPQSAAALGDPVQ